MTIRLETRIYLEDTDAGGIAYHGSYVRFMERARTEYLRSLGMQQSETFAADLSFVVHSMELRFLRPAKLDEIVVISCELEEARIASFVFRQSVRSAATDLAHCEASVVVACIRLSDQKPRRVPKELLDRLLPAAAVSSS